MLRLLEQISIRQFRATWSRTCLVIGGVATGVALIVAINVINASVLANFQDTIDLLAGPAQLEVTLGVGEVGFSESAVDVVRAEPEVDAAIPVTRGVLALADDPTQTLQLFGVDLTDADNLDRYRIALTADRTDMITWLADSHSIALTAAFAERHGIAIGDKISLATPHGVAQFTVRGLLQPEGMARAFGGDMALMDLPAAQLVLARRELIDQIDVVVRKGIDVDRLRQRLVQTLPSDLTVATPVQRGAIYESILSSFQAMLTGLSLLCLVAGTYIIYNTTSTGALHRSLGMAALRLVGAEPRQLFSLLMLEALVLGATGVAIGIPSGIMLARLMTGMVSESMGVVFQLKFAVQRLAVDHAALTRVACVGIASSLFASYFVARRISALEPLAVLRADMPSLAGRARPTTLMFVWLALVLVTIATLIAELQFKSITWGNIGSTLWFASSIVIAVPLVESLSGPVSRVLTRLCGPAGQVASESIFRSSTRTGVTVSGIALVLTVAITFASLARSHRESVSRYFVSGFLASDLSVSAVATEGGWLETPIPADIVDGLRSIPGIRAAEPIRVIPGMLYRGERIGLAALGDGLFDPAKYPPGWYRAGDAWRAVAPLREGRGVNVSISFADRFDVHVGDWITLESPSGPVRLEVVGIVPDYISNRGTVIVSSHLFGRRWNDSSVNRVHVFLEPGANLEAVREAILKQFGARYRLKVLSLAEGVSYLSAKIDRAYAFTMAIQLLIVAVTIAGVFDLLLAAIWERRRELALWRLIGADESTVRWSVVIESATIGAMGAVFGIMLGIVTTVIWIGINFRYLLGYYLEYHFAFAAMGWFVVLVVAMTMTAGYAAARQATARSILEGIQGE